jgi:hypothetical protein
MNKPLKCLLHLRCMTWKRLGGRYNGAHWQRPPRETAIGGVFGPARRILNP